MLKKRWFFLVITIILAVTIFYLSSLSSPPSPKKINLSFIYHILIFFYLSFFLFLSINGDRKIKLRYLIITLVIAVLYAASDEIHQAFVPYRSCTLTDFLTNTSGIFASLIILSLLFLRNKK